MARTVTGPGDLAARFRAPINTTALVVLDTETTLDANCPTITSGNGAPSHTAAAGSLYLRRNASNADTGIYIMISTTWTPILGAS